MKNALSNTQSVFILSKAQFIELELWNVEHTTDREPEYNSRGAGCDREWLRVPAEACREILITRLHRRCADRPGK
jgi:hypothetical protein